MDFHEFNPVRLANSDFLPQWIGAKAAAAGNPAID